MKSHNDYTSGDGKLYGYTIDNGDEKWFWSAYPGDKVQFTVSGTHTDHPMRRTGTVPRIVRWHANKCVERITEEQQ